MAKVVLDQKDWKMEALLSSLSSLTDNVLGYIVIMLCVMVAYTYINSSKSTTPTTQSKEEEEEEEDPDPPRNFTIKQLKHFDGKECERTGETKEVYLSLNGIVFDVSNGRNFYGPDGPYELFAGRECGAALAKMSFDTTFLDDIQACEALNFSEKSELEGWISKFQHYRCYPIKGRLIPDSDLPDPTRKLTKEDLAKNDGCGEIPKGYATPSIYLGADGKVFDMSFGGVLFYGKDCAYNAFAGKDASRALAKMSLDPNVANNPNVSDLTEKEIKVMKDWVKSFEEKKNYPIVGVLA